MVEFISRITCHNNLKMSSLFGDAITSSIQAESGFTKDLMLRISLGEDSF